MMVNFLIHTCMIRGFPIICITHLFVKDVHEQVFEASINAAKPLFLSTRSRHGLALRCGLEEPLRDDMSVVRWETVNSHIMVHFCQSDDFYAWPVLVGEYFDTATTVHHEVRVL